MRMWLLTGVAGVGKSRFVNRVSDIAGPACHVIDPLIQGKEALHPHPVACKLVVVDHASHAPKAVVDSAVGWCRENDKDVVLVDQSRSDLMAAGVDLSQDVIEMELHGAGAKEGVTVTANGETQHLSFERLMTMVRDLRPQ